jgi:hypothetical protein
MFMEWMIGQRVNAIEYKLHPWEDGRELLFDVLLDVDLEFFKRLLKADFFRYTIECLDNI